MLEALIVIAILAILASLAGPSFARWLDQLRAGSARDAMEATIYFARAESIRSGAPSVISPLPACAPALSCGWRVVSNAGTIRQVELGSDLSIGQAGAVKTYTVGARGSMQAARFDFETPRICRKLIISIGGRIRKTDSEGACS